jgi:hypothetical protein
MYLPELTDGFPATRDALHRVAVHVVARARQQATGRFGLRVTPGGFGTPAFGDSVERVRVSRGLLVRESAGADRATATATPIDGATLAELARLTSVDLETELDVGHDTPALGDVAARLVVEPAAADALGAWFTVVAQALDAVAAARPASFPSAVQLWPEHFDAAMDAAFDAAEPTTRRVNLGGSPGDGFHADPYLYVGPWTDDRPGAPDFWNAPFGAVLGYATLRTADDPVAAATAILLDGFDRLSR